MKRLLVILAAIIMMVGLTACGETATEENTQDSSQEATYDTYNIEAMSFSLDHSVWYEDESTVDTSDYNELKFFESETSYMVARSIDADITSDDLLNMGDAMDEMYQDFEAEGCELERTGGEGTEVAGCTAYRADYVNTPSEGVIIEDDMSKSISVVFILRDGVLYEISSMGADASADLDEIIPTIEFGE